MIIVSIQLECKEERTLYKITINHLLTLAKLLYPAHLVINFPRYVGFIIAILISLAYFPKLGYEIFIMQRTYSSRISAYFVLRFNTCIRFLEFYIFIVLLMFHFSACLPLLLRPKQMHCSFLIVIYFLFITRPCSVLQDAFPFVAQRRKNVIVHHYAKKL